MAIKKFDERGLIELNNLLARQDKLVRKLLKQIKTGSIAPGTEQSKGTTDLVPESVLEGIEQVPAYGITREDGRVELYDVSGDNDDDISPTKTAYIHETQAKIAIPSSYFLDLRGIYKTSTTQQYTADLLVLHDIDGNTITLTNVDETNDISVSGPAAGGRDQVATFGDAWVNIFIIYDPVLKNVSSISSLSATSPTLPDGYTFWCRVGGVSHYAGGYIFRTYQMNDVVRYGVQWPKWDTKQYNTFGTVDVSRYVPPTAKLVHGIIGLSSGTSARKMVVASDSLGYIRVGALCDSAGTGDQGYGVSGSKDFILPMLTSQTIWWKTETNSNIYAIGLVGFTDDL